MDVSGVGVVERADGRSDGRTDGRMDGCALVVADSVVVSFGLLGLVVVERAPNSGAGAGVRVVVVIASVVVVVVVVSRIFEGCFFFWSTSSNLVAPLVFTNGGSFLVVVVVSVVVVISVSGNLVVVVVVLDSKISWLGLNPGGLLISTISSNRLPPSLFKTSTVSL